MIHQVHLPDLTRKRLTDVVMLQLRLLCYAASTTTCAETSCAQYLDQHARFRGRGAQIARWLWRAPKRRQPLEAFAQGPTVEKQAWSQRLAHEALTFLRHPAGPLMSYVSKNAASWQQAGAQFLLKFYDDLCAPSGLPNSLFSERGASPFNRQDFLVGFQDENRELYVCAVCDESDYDTRVTDSTYAEIEHYLPKSHYPHLACHPFNLLPICHHCNFLKRNADPLKGGSRNPRHLGDVLLPYRESGLGSQTYLSVQLGKTYAATRFGRLKPRKSIDLGQRIEAFGSVYKVPKRWQERIDEIGEKLFRRIRQLLQSGPGLPSGSDRMQTLLASLDLLLYFLAYEDHGKEPFAFAMTWWLATLINQEVEPASQNPSHPMPQVTALLQAVSSQSSTGDQSRAETPAHSQPLTIARRLREWTFHETAEP
jgi:hypothetical protein